MVSDADGEATLGENWSLVEVLARSIRSMMELSLSRASSSFRTVPGAGDGMLGLLVGDGLRALFEKRASSSVTRLLMSCRDKLGRSSKKEFNLFIV
mgnify:CR=1 FL=1